MNNQLMTTDQVVSDDELIMHLENLGLLKDLTNGEKNSYLQIAKAYNLNPFKREIHVSKYNGQMSIITGYEVYIKRAERSGQLDGWSAITQGSVKNNDLKAVITIHRKDRTHPFVWEASYSEFVQKTKEGNVTKFWQKADFMIKKVAISQAFRLCFSDELGGMPYTKEEMQDTEDVKAEVVKSEIKQPEPAAKKKLSSKAFDQGMEKAKADHTLLDRLENEYLLSDEQTAMIKAAREEIAINEANPA